MAPINAQSSTGSGATLKTGATAGLGMNEIGRASLRLLNPLACDAYEDNRASGGFIVIDEFSDETLAAGMICRTRPAEMAN